ncbi:MAG: Uma2 family endonuclease [Pirellulales bacterium]
MSATAIRTGHYTFDDFLLLIKEHEKADLLDGVIYMASPESTDDNELGGWLYRLMSEFAKETNQGKCYFSRVAFRITDKRGPEPDVAFVAKERLRIVERGFVDGPPDIAVEIVSPDSAQRDYDLKMNIYEAAGVKEYWVIDPDEQRATFLRRHGERFVEVKPQDGRYESQVLVGFFLEIAWLWSKERPSLMAVLPGMLRGRDGT